MPDELPPFPWKIAFQADGSIVIEHGGDRRDNEFGKRVVAHGGGVGKPGTAVFADGSVRSVQDPEATQAESDSLETKLRGYREHNEHLRGRIAELEMRERVHQDSARMFSDEAALHRGRIAAALAICHGSTIAIPSYELAERIAAALEPG